MIEQIGQAQGDQTILMLDQLWRIIAYNVLAGFLYACGAAPIVYTVLRLVRHVSISDPPAHRG